MGLDGPAAQVLITGGLDLVAQTYDQEVLVYPHVSGTLPLLGWLGGGTSGGVLMLIMQTLFGDQMDEGSVTRYRIEGSWDEPQVTEIKSQSESAPAAPAETQ